MRLFPYLFALFALIGLSTGGGKISLVEELPGFQVKGEKVDACVAYKQFATLWVPLWNWDAKYVFAQEGAEYGHLLIDKGLLAQLEKKYGGAADAIPFWDKIGGKLLLPIILFLLVRIRTLMRTRNSDSGREREQSTWHVKILGITLLLVYLWLCLAIQVPEGFLNGDNMFNLFLRTAMYGVLGIGVAFVIITAGIDLSIGSIVCLSGVLLSLFLSVKYDPSYEEQVFAIDPEQQVIVLGQHSDRFKPGDRLRYYKSTQTRSAVVSLSSVEVTKIPDDAGNLTVSGSLLRVEGLAAGKSRRARDGTVTKLYPVREVDAEKGLVLIEGNHEGLGARDKIRFINPNGGMEEIVLAEAQAEGGNTRLRFEGDTGSLGDEWLAMPRFRDQIMPVPVALLAVLGIALLLGVVHGLLVTKIHLQPFVVTLCGLLLYRGISRWLVGDEDTGYGNEYESSLSLLTNGKFVLFTLEEPYGTYSIPYAFFIFLLVAILAAVFLNKTIYGRYMLALGRNVEAARFSGIDTDRMTIIGYVICTVMAALGGLFFLNYAGSLSPSSHGNFFELYAIAAAVLGGCSLRGGEGSIYGVVIGTALMVTLKMLITLMKISDTLEFAIIGIVILVGVIADELIKKAVARRQASKG